MKISLKAIAIATGVLWGGAILFLGLVNLARPSYALSVLQMVSSVYPGFHASRSIGDVLTGTGYALIDGAIGGLFFGWIYNFFLGRNSS
jgi:hypothetical protein